MRIITAIIAALYGLAFIAAGVTYFLPLDLKMEVASGSPADHFFRAMAPTGYLAVVKCLEIAGGLLTAIPMTRRFGLLILGPIALNILIYHLTVMGGADLLPAAILAGAALLLGLLEARAFAAYFRGAPATAKPAAKKA
jgi:hypothetical protein